ncbi:hypothetical protein C1645_761943 [Glomus cerebriforme]|uniref:Uncharacterized protein n=1 Tax=Glomus cerebriforme TaxID=658196 RepID=A0A397TFF9_9GLOM|nr:hypothetical protein C1645_761943 [Glomus cerebriforme]
MENCLYNFLHNIHKIPTSPSTNNNNIINYYNRNYSQRLSLIEVVKSENNDQEMANIIDIFSNLNSLLILFLDEFEIKKNQAIEMIVKLSKLSAGEVSQIKHQTISTILNRATRMRRLLEIASDSYTIFDAFSDLNLKLFLPKRMTIINYKR